MTCQPFCEKKLLSLLFWLTGRIDGDWRGGKHMGQYSETDGLCIWSREVPKRLMWFLTMPTKIIVTTAFTFPEGPLPRSSWFTSMTSVMPPPMKARERGQQRSDQSWPWELSVSTHIQWVSPWKLGSVLKGRAIGWLSNLSTMLILASCFSMSSCRVQDMSCCSL